MFDVIVNPVAYEMKKGKPLAALEKIFKEHGVEYALHYSEKPGDTTEIARRLTEKECDLIVMGGDGTLNEVLSGIVNFDGLRLGIIPCGTGNDFVKAAGVPLDVEKAIELILSGKTKAVDYVQIGDRRAMNCAGAGMDVDTLVKYSQIKWLHGKIKYYAALLSVLAKLHFHKMRITSEEKTEETEVFMSAVANGIYIGGGMPVSPLSDPTDGLLDVVVIRKLPRRKVLPMLMKFLKGKHINYPFVEHFRTKNVTLEVLDDGITEVDGELYEQKVLNCCVVPGKLRIFANTNDKGEK